MLEESSIILRRLRRHSYVHHCTLASPGRKIAASVCAFNIAMMASSGDFPPSLSITESTLRDGLVLRPNVTGEQTSHGPNWVQICSQLYEIAVLLLFG